MLKVFISNGVEFDMNRCMCVVCCGVSFGLVSRCIYSVGMFMNMVVCGSNDIMVGVLKWLSYSMGLLLIRVLWIVMNRLCI